MASSAFSLALTDELASFFCVMAETTGLSILTLSDCLKMSLLVFLDDAVAYAFALNADSQTACRRQTPSTIVSV